MSRVVYAIYRQAYRDGRPVADQNGDGLGSRVALGVCLESCAAEARLGRLMQAARRTANPFALHHRLTVAQILELGVPWRSAPRGGWDYEPRGWYDELERWYDQEAPHLTDDERAKVWALFDARPLYGIYEVPLGEE